VRQVKYYLLLILVASSGCRHYAAADDRNTTYIYPPWKHTWGVVRATPFKLRLFVGGKTKFNDPQGIAVARLNAWEDTTRVGDDDEITAYGVNSGGNCIIYNRSMFSLGIYGLDPDHVKFNRPWGIAADSKGRVYVVDRGNSRVVRLYNPGKGLHFVAFLGGPGDEPGRFIDPRGVAIDSRGVIYVTDAALGRVTLFNDSGEVIDIWSGFDGPDGIAVVGPGERWSYRPGQTFAVVIDSLHQRVRKLSLDGEPLAETTADDWGGNEAFLAYVTLDYHNQLIITDKRNGCLHKLDADLNYLTRFGRPGNGDYEFDEPRGVSIYRRFGQLIVAERSGAQYLWVAVDVPRFEARVVTDSIWRDLNIDFELTEPAFCEMDVLDGLGRLTARLTTKRRFPTGRGHLAWNLRVPKGSPFSRANPSLPLDYKPGEPLPDGEYVIRGRFRATYSSREYFSRDVSTRFKLESKQSR